MAQDIMTGEEISQEDLDRMTGAKKVQGPIQKIRSVHHRLAQLKAQGLKDSEISAMTGWSQSRLCILGSDPTFAGLVQFYLSKSAEAFVEVQTQFLSLGLDAMAELHERIVENPEEVSDKLLLDTAAFAMDRAGFAPVQKSVSATVGGQLSEDELRRVKEELKRGARANVVTKNYLRAGGSQSMSEAVDHSEGETEGERGGGENLREEGGEVPDQMDKAGGHSGRVIPWPVD